MPQPLPQFPSQPASQTWPPMQTTPQTPTYFPQTYMSQEQRMQEYYRFEQELARSSFQRFQTMISSTGYSQPFVPMPQCTIEQYDDHSCGPFALREVEILLGYQVERDLECPFAIRHRHARTISKAVTNSIDRIGRSPLPERHQMSSDIEEIDKADFVPKPMVATSSAHVSKTPALSMRPSPELEVSIPYTNLELTTPSPVLGDVDYTQDQEESPTHIQKELISTLKVAQEKPKPRLRP